MSRNRTKKPDSKASNKEELSTMEPDSRGESNRGKPFKNDPEWLNHNPELIESAARLNFATRLGMEYHQDVSFINSKDTESRDDFSIVNPSFMTYYYEPSIGKSVSMNSPINLSARGISTKIRTQISGSRNADPSDYMIHILGISNIYDAINIAVRAYGVATYYNTWDIASPSVYLSAMGFKPDSVMNNMAYFNGLINKAILKVATLAMPNNIKYINRHAALTSQIFADGELVHRAQKFMFMPTFFWKYDPTASSTGGSLVPVWWIENTDAFAKANGDIDTNPLKTVDQWYEMVSELIAAYENDSDVWTIDGDIRRTFGDSLIVMNTIPFDYAIEPVYSPAMSTQMENLTIVHGHELGDMLNDSTAKKIRDRYISDRTVTQDMSYNGLKYSPKYYLRSNAANLYANVAITDEHVLNFHWDSPTPLEIAYAAQLTNLFDVGTATADNSRFVTWEPVAPQCEVVIAAVLYSPERNYSRVWSVNSTADVNFRTIAGLTRFKWHSPYYLWSADQQTDTSVGIVGVVADLDNWTFITKKDIQQIHEAALLSYFDVPLR